MDKMESDLVFAFDLGVTGIGECVRQGSEIKHLKTHIIPEDIGSLEEARKRRRQYRTRIAHKKREDWWRQCAKEAGIEVLETRQPIKDKSTGRLLNFNPDPRMLREFPAKGDKTIYTSCLLRIALLRNVKLEGWQIYKAIWSAIQHRGYDKDLPWKKTNQQLNKEEKENIEATQQYEKELKSIFNKEEFYYPCYLEAFRMGIWSPENPDNLTGKIGTAPRPTRNKDGKNTLIVPRTYVEKELRVMLQNASKQFPKLKGKEDYILYGPAEKPYASYVDNQYKQFRGREWDWQGLLGQKIPRFDNRAISKCRLIPRFNVCKAEDPLNQEVVFLMKLKNMRFFDRNNRLCGLSVENLNDIYNKYYQKKYITKKQWEKIVKEQLGGSVYNNATEVEKPKISGRSSFSRPALRIIKELLLSGKSPHILYKELCEKNTNTDKNKGLVNDDFLFLLQMPENWDDFTIPDDRNINVNLAEEDRRKKIDDILNGISNPIVRHRLRIFTARLHQLSMQYGKPDKVVIELVRDPKTGLMGQKRKEEFQRIQKENRKKWEHIKNKIQELGIVEPNESIKLKVALWEEQEYIDPYSLKPISPTELETCEIDHIVPLSRGGSDGYINLVLTTYNNNQDKDNNTPYEWLKNKDIWPSYLEYVNGNGNFNKKKKELLVNEDACSLIERYEMLAATAYIAKLSQKIISLMFDWPHMSKGSERKIIVANGGYTAKIRRTFNLDILLHKHLSKDEFIKMVENGEIEEKNRQNPKHHALDALVISCLPYFLKPSPVKKSSMERRPEWFNPDFCKDALNRTIPEPLTFKTPAFDETIYGKRYVIKNGKKYFCFVSHFGKGTRIEDFYKIADAKKYIKNIFDEKIQRAFEEKINQPGITEDEWRRFIEEYGRENSIRRILIKESSDFPEDTEAVEYGEIGKIRGQYYKGKEHKGQIIYKEHKKWKVMPVYIFESPYKKIEEYKRKYGKVFFFHSGQLVYIREIPGKIVEGIYTLKTIQRNGQVKISSLDSTNTLLFNVNELLDTGKMRPYKNRI